MQLPAPNTKWLVATLSSCLVLSGCGGGSAPAETAEPAAVAVAAAPDTAASVDSFVGMPTETINSVPNTPPNATIDAVASPATYYVDLVNGNDSWAGTTQTAGTANGPWRTLARLASATLAPGDTVLLACGQTWNETLRFGGSGSAAAPIRIAAFPATCTTPPAIDGKVVLPASAWQLHTGQIYKANLNANLVPNGNLAQGTNSWRQYAPAADSKIVLDTVCTGGGFPCLRFTTGSSSSTLITPAFAATGGVNYTAVLRVLVPSGVNFTVDLRRMSAPYTLAGLPTAILVGNGAWQTVTVNFVAGATVPDARLDIGISGAGVVALMRDASVTLAGASTLAVSQVFENDVGVTVAHHPNQGFNTNAPGSYFLSTPVPSASYVNTAGRTVSQYLMTGSDLVLPPGASITPGLTVTIRSSDWSISDYTVTAYTAGKLIFSPETTYPLSAAGWGYYFTGALWMLDSPGEWFHDAAANALYVRTATSTPPSASISYTALALGADIKGKSYVTLQGLAFRRAKLGVDMSNTTGAKLQSVQISQTGTFGVLAPGAVSPVISGSKIIDTLGDAIHAYSATGLQAVGNDITNSGVRLRSDGSIATLPASAWGAINAGANAVISDNRLLNIAYDGIVGGNDSAITGNAVQSFCLVFNDCGAIHPFQTARQRIQGNLLVDGRSSTFGTPSTYPPHAVGIYMDLHTSASTVTGNTFANADWGMHLLDAYNNTITDNLFYGNRTTQLWVQQRGNTVNATQGDVFGNIVKGNDFFPTNGNVSVNQTTTMSTAAIMASYDMNRHSTLISPTIASEGTGTGLHTYTFPDWQAAVGPSGPRLLDINGLVAAPMAGRAVGIMGGELIAAGNLTIGTGTGVNGWGRSGSPAAPTLSLGGCPPGITSCIRATSAPTSTSLMSSPKFPTVKNSWYRMSFDAAVSSTTQGVSVVIRDATTSVTISPTLLASGSTAWKRYSFVLQATADAPVNASSLGARIDFQSIQPGQWITVSNLQIAPMTAAAGDVPYTFIYNATRAPTFLSCPVTDVTVCASYYSYADGTPVTWPARLEPLQAKAIFAPNASLVDSDNDGIADSQDLCPATVPGSVVNNKGCTLGS